MGNKAEPFSVAAILGTENPEEPGVSGRRSLALAILRQNPDGITAKFLAERLEVTPRRGSDILDELEKSREAYSRKVPGIAAHLYYPNGKLIHKYLQESREFGQQIFRASFHEGRIQPRLQIQERRFALMEGETLQGSIFVDSNNIEPLITFLQEMLQKFNQFSPENGKGK